MAYFYLPPSETSVQQVEADITNHYYQKIVVARHLHDTDQNKLWHKFIADSGANRHMCHTKALFLSISAYKGVNTYTTLGDGTTRCKSKCIGVIEIQTEQGKKICFHSIIYVPTLNISLFSVNQHMWYVGCYKHSENKSA